eukprot:TRINITY_DN8045_c0_g1_i1.p1 TRINITY_DN8045_c0_g1~~TRINITY_DN8045_c0_g1_i1.p1  ORF type:complete len:582 (+),score=106.33 TRINITY_DN8045_c0_g1_i1:46-1791(+)
MLLCKLLFSLLLLSCVFASEKNHKYIDNEEVIVWANKVGPFSNPQEKYEYYKLPFCKPKERVESKMESLGEALLGYELVKSTYDIKFLEVVTNREICVQSLSKDEVATFIDAVEQEYMFEFFIDDLPVWNLVGAKTERGDKIIFTHYNFDISYNKNRIIDVKLKTEFPMILKGAGDYKFTYSVSWTSTDEEFEHRFDKYLDNEFFEHQIHWFSIFNSIMMVLFLVGLVIMILVRTVRADFLKFFPEDGNDDVFDIGDDKGWRQVRLDVFRPPPYLGFFSAFIGTGIQLFFLSLLVVLISIAFYHNHPTYRRGSVVTSYVVCYAFTSFLGGYISGFYYNENNGKNWIRTMALTTLLFPGFISAVVFVLNFIGIGYGSLAAIPFLTMLSVVGLWVGVSFPLTLLGSIVGRNYPIPFLKKTGPLGPFPKPIPEKKFYENRWVHVVLSGILPFGSIFIEMYFVFTSLWQYKYYYVFGFTLLVFLILTAVTLCVSVVSTYFLLNTEDYRWQWTSFWSGASVAGYVYAYSIYFFIFRSKMYGLLQITYYFVYVGIATTALGLMTGSISFLGCYIFVRLVYGHLSKYE